MMIGKKSKLNRSRDNNITSVMSTIESFTGRTSSIDFQTNESC